MSDFSHSSCVGLYFCIVNEQPLKAIRHFRRQMAWKGTETRAPTSTESHKKPASLSVLTPDWSTYRTWVLHNLVRKCSRGFMTCCRHVQLLSLVELRLSRDRATLCIGSILDRAANTERKLGREAAAIAARGKTNLHRSSVICCHTCSWWSLLPTHGFQAVGVTSVAVTWKLLWRHQVMSGENGTQMHVILRREKIRVPLATEQKTEQKWYRYFVEILSVNIPTEGESEALYSHCK